MRHGNKLFLNYSEDRLDYIIAICGLLYIESKSIQ